MNVRLHPFPSESVEPPERAPGSKAVIIGLTLGFWAFNFVVVTLSNWLDALADWQIRAGGRALATAGGLVLCWAIAALLQRLRHWSPARRAGLLFFLAIAAGDGLSWLSALGWALLGGPALPTKPGTALFNLAYWTWFVLAWGSLYLAIDYSRTVRERERAWAAMQSLAQQAQLRALRYQVRPHFLFNAMNSIASLILDGRSNEGVQLVRRLADFLRKSLELDPVEDLRLSDELELQSLYLSVEKVRFPDLDVRIDAEPGLEDVLVPTLILQPLVENAVKHSVSRSLAPATIAITARRIDDEIELRVEDSGSGSEGSVPGTGIGLSNVRERLRHRFGTEHSFEAGPKSPRGYCVRIRFPGKVLS